MCILREFLLFIRVNYRNCNLREKKRRNFNVKFSSILYSTKKNVFKTLNNLFKNLNFSNRNMGVRLFSKADLKDRETVELKICQEGIDIVDKYFTKRILHVHDRNDLFKLLSGCNPDSDKFSDDLQKQLKECKCVGSIIISCHDKNTKYTTDGRSSPIQFTGWLGKSTVRPFLNIQSRKFLLTLLDIDDEEIGKL